MRLISTVVVLLILLLASFVLYGDALEDWMGAEGLAWLRERGAWSGLAGAALIVADVLLPMPASGVMAALGQIHGGLVGGLYSLLGSVVGGASAYAAVRAAGPRAAAFLAGAEALGRLQAFFDRRGSWAIALTRPLPLVPEVLCCLAGLAPMPPGRFLVALLAGSVPQAFLFAGLGAAGRERPVLSLALAVAIPALLLPLFLGSVRRRHGARAGDPGGAAAGGADSSSGPPRPPHSTQ